MLDTVTLDTFEPLIGQPFSLRLPDEELELKLTDVEALPTGSRRRRNAPEPKRAPFSLFFTASRLVPQAMYPISHQVFGEEPASIFIVPIREIPGGYEYEAVFT